MTESSRSRSTATILMDPPGPQLVGLRHGWPLAADLVDSTGAYLDLTGVEVDGRLAFQRTATVDGVTQTQRMVWLDVTTDSFRWQWQRSDDAGASWTLLWEIAYRRP